MAYYYSKHLNLSADILLTVGGLNWLTVAVRNTGRAHSELALHDALTWAPNELSMVVYYAVGVAGIVKTLMLAQAAMSNYCCDMNIQFVDEKHPA